MKRSQQIERTAAMIMNESLTNSARTIVYTLREFICDTLEDIELWRDIVKQCRDTDSKRWDLISYFPNHPKNPF